MILQRTLNVKHGLAQGPGSWTNPLCILSQLSADPELLLLESFWGRCGKCFTRASPTPNKQWQVHALCSGPSAALHPHQCLHTQLQSFTLRPKQLLAYHLGSRKDKQKPHACDLYGFIQYGLRYMGICLNDHIMH